MVKIRLTSLVVVFCCLFVWLGKGTNGINESRMMATKLAKVFFPVGGHLENDRATQNVLVG